MPQGFMTSSESICRSRKESIEKCIDMCTELFSSCIPSYIAPKNPLIRTLCSEICKSESCVKELDRVRDLFWRTVIDISLELIGMKIIKPADFYEEYKDKPWCRRTNYEFVPICIDIEKNIYQRLVERYGDVRQWLYGIIQRYS